jgi:hypothetical protein
MKKQSKKDTVALKIKEQNKKLKAAENVYQRASLKIFNGFLSRIFDKTPGLESFKWRQYTPSWNDGDPCTFGCHFESLLFNDEEESEIWDLDRKFELISNPDLSRARIESELKTETASWQTDQLKRDLKFLEDGDFETFSKFYSAKKEIIDTFQLFDESFFEKNFGEGLVKIYKDGSSEVNFCDRD